MEEQEIARSYTAVRLFQIVAVAVSILAALSAHAADKQSVQKKVSRKVDRTHERRLYTSRSLTEAREIPNIEQSEYQDYTPRATGYDILIRKSDRKMTIFMSGKPYKTYRVYLGFTPEGQKTRRGDGCTPEGRYYICKRNAASAYYRSLLISYPSPEDAKKGVEAGLVDDSVLNAATWAYSRGAQPPQETRLGGNVCIHGEGNRQRPAKDWTAGCVAVTNDEMTEIFSLIPVGTPVTILP